MLGRVASIDWMIALAGLPLFLRRHRPDPKPVGARDALIASGLVGAAVTLISLTAPGR
jgi:hypothetical protein